MALVSVDKAAELTRRIRSREARIGIVGMGYVGLPLTLLFSEERFRGYRIRHRCTQGWHAEPGRLLHRPHPYHRGAAGSRERLHGDH